MESIVKKAILVYPVKCQLDLNVFFVDSYLIPMGSVIIKISFKIFFIINKVLKCRWLLHMLTLNAKFIFDKVKPRDFIPITFGDERRT